MYASILTSRGFICKLNTKYMIEFSKKKGKTTTGAFVLPYPTVSHLVFVFYY